MLLHTHSFSKATLSHLSKEHHPFTQTHMCLHTYRATDVMKGRRECKQTRFHPLHWSVKDSLEMSPYSKYSNSPPQVGVMTSLLCHKPISAVRTRTFFWKSSITIYLWLIQQLLNQCKTSSEGDLWCNRLDLNKVADTHMEDWWCEKSLSQETSEGSEPISSENKPILPHLQIKSSWNNETWVTATLSGQTMK